MSEQTLHILLIEDDIDDVDLLKEAFVINNIDVSLEVINEGDKVAPYLANVELTPSLIIMDLNLPKTSGREILKMIKTLPAFQYIPLVVFSTSSARDDINYAYSMGASKFITKPVNIEGWNSTVIIMEQVASGPINKEQ
ncbi:MAG: response regulator [Chitinophagaceae bacterium]